VAVKDLACSAGALPRECLGHGSARMNTDKSVTVRVDPWLAFFDFENQGRTKLQFEVNGQTYFLTFVEDERCWCVFAPTASGVRRIPVYVDAPAYERVALPGELGRQ